MLKTTNWKKRAKVKSKPKKKPVKEKEVKETPVVINEIDPIAKPVVKEGFNKTKCGTLGCPGYMRTLKDDENEKLLECEVCEKRLSLMKC